MGAYHNIITNKFEELLLTVQAQKNGDRATIRNIVQIYD